MLSHQHCTVIYRLLPSTIGPELPTWANPLAIFLCHYKFIGQCLWKTWNKSKWLNWLYLRRTQREVRLIIAIDRFALVLRYYGHHLHCEWSTVSNIQHDFDVTHRWSRWCFSVNAITYVSSRCAETSRFDFFPESLFSNGIERKNSVRLDWCRWKIYTRECHRRILSVRSCTVKNPLHLPLNDKTGLNGATGESCHDDRLWCSKAWPIWATILTMKHSSKWTWRELLETTLCIRIVRSF